MLIATCVVIFSSSEHRPHGELLWSVVVRCASAFDVYTLEITFGYDFMKLGQNVCFDNI